MPEVHQPTSETLSQGNLFQFLSAFTAVELLQSRVTTYEQPQLTNRAQIFSSST